MRVNVIFNPWTHANAARVRASLDRLIEQDQPQATPRPVARDGIKKQPQPTKG